MLMTNSSSLRAVNPFFKHPTVAPAVPTVLNLVKHHTQLQFVGILCHTVLFVEWICMRETVGSVFIKNDETQSCESGWLLLPTMPCTREYLQSIWAETYAALTLFHNNYRWMLLAVLFIISDVCGWGFEQTLDCTVNTVTHSSRVVLQTCMIN